MPPAPRHETIEIMALVGRNRLTNRSHPQKKTPLRMGFRKEAARLEMWYVKGDESQEIAASFCPRPKKGTGHQRPNIVDGRNSVRTPFETMVETIVGGNL